MPATLDPDLRLALERVGLRPPAPDAELQGFRASVSKPLPDDYLRFLCAADGGEGWIGENYIQLASAAGAAETTRALERFVPALFFFGRRRGRSSQSDPILPLAHETPEVAGRLGLQ